MKDHQYLAYREFVKPAPIKPIVVTTKDTLESRNKLRKDHKHVPELFARTGYVKNYTALELNAAKDEYGNMLNKNFKGDQLTDQYEIIL